MVGMILILLGSVPLAVCIVIEGILAVMERLEWGGTRS